MAQGSRFRVQVYTPQGGLQVRECVAPSLQQLQAQWDDAEGLLMAAEPVVASTRRGRRPRFALRVFCQQLLALLQAGLQLVEAIDTLAHQERNPAQREVLVALQTPLRAGLSFSQALEGLPEAFPALFRASIRSSEQTGGVPEALARFIQLETQLEGLRGRLQGVLIYPALLLLVGSLVVAFLLAYVVPRFSQVFADRLETMPYLSGLVIRFGLLVAEHPLQAAAIACAVLAGVALLLAHPPLRAGLLSAMARLPWLGQRVREFELVRIYRALAMLMGGGVPAVSALQLVTGLVPPQRRAAMAQVITLTGEGTPISAALHQQGFTTVVSERLLATGERSGKMVDMLERSADFLDAELQRSLDRTMRLLEPLLMVVIGAVIGGIVMLMYLPIFELSDSLG